jgi:deoxyribonuclease V
MTAFSWARDEQDAARDQAALREIVKSEKLDLPSVARGLAIGTAYADSDEKAVAFGIRFRTAGRWEDDEVYEVEDVSFPYVPGLLAYRVGPAVCKLLDRHVDKVDILIFDGQGIAHPRGIGLAAHIGALYNKPSIGITRNSLFGRYIEPARGRFNYSGVTHPKTGQLIGYAVSLGDNCNPIYVSPGHRCDVPSAFDFLKRISEPRDCVPKPIRRAHAGANRLVREKPWSIKQ